MTAIVTCWAVVAAVSGVWLYAIDRRAMRSALGTVAVIGCALVYVAVISHV